MSTHTLSTAPTSKREADLPRSGAYLVVLLECDRPCAGSSRHDLDGLEHVTIGRAAQRTTERTRSRLAIGIPDGRISTQHARMASSHDRWVVEDLGAKNGLFVNGERCERKLLEPGDIIECGHTLLLFEYGELLSPPDRAAGERDTTAFETFVGPLIRTFENIASVTRVDVPMLVHGETGTGKEVMAREIHALKQTAGAFVAVNCGALPATLVESELFGYKRGAFSGATEDRVGLVRSADRGTLFLDEIGDLPLASQASLLRVLQEREVMPVGGTRPIAVDFALVAATHHDLEKLAASGQFRRDLYARIAAFVIRLPALRERREDLGILIATLLRRMASESTRFSVEAVRAMLAYDWPLNIRELESSLRVAVALARGNPIQREHLPEPVLASRATVAVPAPVAARPRVVSTEDDETRRASLEALLRSNAGNVSAVARALKISRIHVHRLIEKYGLDLDAYR